MHPESISLSAPETTPESHSQASDSSASRQSIDGIPAASDPVAAIAASEEAEILQASIKAGSVAQIVIAVIAVIGLIYLLKLVMVTTLFSILLAFVLEPLVGRLSKMHIPRTIGALLAVALMVCLAAGLTYFFYGRAVAFATQLPKYSGKICSAMADLREQTNKIENSARSVIASPTAAIWRSRFASHLAYRG